MNKPTVSHALIIGISDYEPRDEDGLEIDLNGCRFDAKNVLHFATLNARLAAKAFRNPIKRNSKLRKIRKGKSGSPRCTTLYDSAATADNIRNELATLCKKIKPDTAGLFYRSGHGTVITKALEADGTDEAFCAYDALNGGYVIDDEIAAIIAANLDPRATLYIIADTCHSGDSHRSLNLVQTRGMLAPKSSVKAYHDQKRTFVYSDKTPPNVIALYACAPDEYSYEQIDEESGKVRGVYTLLLEKHIPSLIDGTISIDDVHVEVSKGVAAYNSDNRKQTPQLERYA